MKRVNMFLAYAFVSFKQPEQKWCIHDYTQQHTEMPGFYSSFHQDDCQKKKNEVRKYLRKADCYTDV